MLSCRRPAPDKGSVLHASWLNQRIARQLNFSSDVSCEQSRGTTSMSSRRAILGAEMYEDVLLPKSPFEFSHGALGLFGVEFLGLHRQ